MHWIDSVPTLRGSSRNDGVLNRASDFGNPGLPGKKGPHLARLLPV